MREAGAASGLHIDVENIAAVVLTHLHADHSSGLEGLGFYAHFVLGRRMPILAHPKVAERLWDGHLAAGMEWSMRRLGDPLTPRRFDDFFEIRLLDESQAVTFGPFAIECRPTIHSLPTTAVRIHAGGRRLGCSADTAYDPGLIDWLSAADLIVHETGHGIHTPYEKLAALPENIRRKMRLTHYSDDFDIAGSVIPVLRQGEIVDV
jgi:ribonuclease BN (tRNA processing enzyme)